MLAPSAAAHAAGRAGPGLGRADAGRETRAADRSPGEIRAGVARPDHGEQPEDRRPARRVVAPQHERGDDQQEDDAGACQACSAHPQPAPFCACDDERSRRRGGRCCNRSDHHKERADRSQSCDADRRGDINRRPAEQPAPFEPGEHARRSHCCDEDGAAQVGRAERNGHKHCSRRCAQAKAARAASHLRVRHARFCHINATFDGHIVSWATVKRFVPPAVSQTTGRSSSWGGPRDRPSFSSARAAHASCTDARPRPAGTVPAMRMMG